MRLPTDAVGRVDQLLILKQQFADRLRAAKAKGVALRLAEELIGYPMLTATLAKDRYGVSYQAANTAIAAGRPRDPPSANEGQL